MRACRAWPMFEIVSESGTAPLLPPGLSLLSGSISVCGLWQDAVDAGPGFGGESVLAGGTFLRSIEATTAWFADEWHGGSHRAGIK